MSAAKSPRGVVVGAIPRVNLLPKSELDRRSNAALARRWVAVGIGALLIVVVLIGGGYAYSLMSSMRLTAEQNRASQLSIDLAELAPVSRSVAQRRSLSAQLEQAMAGDLAWRPVLDGLAAQLPDDAVVTGYSLAAGPVPAGDDPSVQVGIDGTLTVITATPLPVAEVIDAVRGVEDVLYVDIRQLLRDADEEPDSYEYTIQVQLDQTVYSRRFVPASEDTPKTQD
ncbi:PilN domain-containing protein [Microbacterium suwonense]|uniref:Uncharacterized protein n=2 Tax=Microbacterium suwonense TaxID=683047 RepID=A0ABN6X7N8_9MICO|nr:hypothetical protein GCM10025863_32130 [Microbacterium suwonense]